MPRWVALVCAFVCGASAVAPAAAAGGPPSARRFGFDSAKVYAHAGLEAVFTGASGSGEYDRTRWEEANTAMQGLVQAHAYRLVARLGAGSSYPDRRLADRNGSSGGSRTWTTYYGNGLTEASLGLRLGAPDADEGFRLGLMPLQGNADAILFGNYLARYHPYPTHAGRGLGSWDSLGALAPKAAGIRLALGRNDGPVRAEGWMVRDGEDYSWLAFLSGTAPRKLKWGVGVSAFRAIVMESAPSPGKGPVTDTAGVFVEVSPAPDTVTVAFPQPAFLVSARASLDFASLFGRDAPEGRYGGLFAEAALLGWKDAPIYYTDWWDRALWTAGTRIPAFGWLDACVAQVEWRRHRDGSPVFSGYGENRVPSPTPDTIGAVPAVLGPSPAPRRASPWSMGLFMAKRFGPHVEAQARLMTDEEDEAWYGPLRRVQALARMVFHLR